MWSCIGGVREHEWGKWNGTEFANYIEYPFPCKDLVKIWLMQLSETGYSCALPVLVLYHSEHKITTYFETQSLETYRHYITPHADIHIYIVYLNRNIICSWKRSYSLGCCREKFFTSLGPRMRQDWVKFMTRPRPLISLLSSLESWVPQHYKPTCLYNATQVNTSSIT